MSRPVNWYAPTYSRSQYCTRLRMACVLGVTYELILRSEGYHYFIELCDTRVIEEGYTVPIGVREFLADRDHSWENESRGLEAYNKIIRLTEPEFIRWTVELLGQRDTYEMSEAL